MRIDNIEIENFRIFAGKHTIQLSKSNITTIVGVNGAGKTSLLDTIGISLRALLRKSKFLKIDNDTHYNASFYTIRAMFQISFKGKRLHPVINVKSNDIGYGMLFDEHADEANFIIYQQINNKENASLTPLILHYPVDRAFVEGKKSLNLFDASPSETKHYIFDHAFDAKINVANILAWYVHQTNIENSEKVRRRDFDYQLPALSFVTNAINNFLNALEDSCLTVLNINIDSRAKQLKIHKKSDEEQKKEQLITFNQLSAGEKLMVGMVMDIAYRMAALNPYADNPLETKGIILIDEIELHLHPKWQASILTALTTAFPNVQFIVTTHSPLVLSHLRSEQLVLLHNGKFTSGNEIHEIYGRDANAILSYFMGATDRPRHIKKQMSEILHLLDGEQPDIAMARAKLNELKTQMGGNDLGITDLEMQISFTEDEIY